MSNPDPESSAEYWAASPATRPVGALVWAYNDHRFTCALCTRSLEAGNHVVPIILAGDEQDRLEGNHGASYTLWFHGWCWAKTERAGEAMAN